jgi:hypothetical protein
VRRPREILVFNSLVIRTPSIHDDIKPTRQGRIGFIQNPVRSPWLIDSVPAFYSSRTTSHTCTHACPCLIDIGQSSLATNDGPGTTPTQQHANVKGDLISRGGKKKCATDRPGPWRLRSVRPFSPSTHPSNVPRISHSFLPSLAYIAHPVGPPCHRARRGRKLIVRHIYICRVPPFLTNSESLPTPPSSPQLAATVPSTATSARF